MKHLNKIIALACVSMLWACADLDTVPEGGTVTEDQNKAIIEKDPSLIAAQINGLYSRIATQYCIFGPPPAGRHDDAGFPTVCISQDINGPDMVVTASNYEWFTVSADYSDRSDTYANPYERYAVFYAQIKLANEVLLAIAEDTENPQLKAYRAQALAVRAFDYLGLVPYFQFKYKGNEDKPGIPLIPEDGQTDLANNPRAALRDVYAQILSDLDKAIPLLAGYERPAKNEVNQNVAYGLRARANLYMENWAEAAADAAKALEGTTFYSRTDVSKPAFISADEPSWMWALLIGPSMMPNPYPSWPAWLSSFTGDGYTAAVACYRMINKVLFDKIPATDVRKGWWVDAGLHSPNLASVTWASATGDAVATLANNDKAAFFPYTNVKFWQYGGAGATTNAGDWCIMRAEEMLLIQAEATAMAGNLPGGKQLLENFVKTYRDPSYTSTAANTAAFQNEIWFQRRVELWGEGFSMSDIMRLSKPVVRVVAGKETNYPDDYQFNINADDGWLLMRFPQRETNANRGIVNNTEGTLPVRGQNPAIKDGVTD